MDDLSSNGRQRLVVDLPMPVDDMPPHLFQALRIAGLLLARLVEKEQAYGASWKRRGGVGAFFATVRKWDRVEETARRNGWDVFQAMAANDAAILDDIGDLIGYLLLWLGDNELRGGDATGFGPMQAILERMQAETQRRGLPLTEDERRKARGARPAQIPPEPGRVPDAPLRDSVHPVTGR